MIKLISEYDTVRFFEEGIRSGGIGEHIASRLIEIGAKCDYRIHAVDGVFVPHQTTAEALHTFGLDTEAIIKAME